MIQWDSSGTRGVKGKYEISLVPMNEGWCGIVWVHKSTILTTPVMINKESAKTKVEEDLGDLEKSTERLLERIKYVDPDDPEDEEY